MHSTQAAGAVSAHVPDLYSLITRATRYGEPMLCFTDFPWMALRDDTDEDEWNALVASENGWVRAWLGKGGHQVCT